MTQKSNSYLLSLLQGSVTFFHSFHYCYSQMLRLTLRQKLLPLLWLKRTERVAQDGGEDDGGEGEGPEDVAAAPLQPANQRTAVNGKGHHSSGMAEMIFSLHVTGTDKRTIFFYVDFL